MCKCKPIRVKGGACESEIMQYIREGKRSSRTEEKKDGSIINYPGSRGNVVGIMVAFISPDDSNQIVIGYSKCKLKCANGGSDQWDKEFGLNLARERAMKWCECSTVAVLNNNVKISDARKEREKQVNEMIANGHPVPAATEVIVPITISTQIRAFILRAYRYYKNYTLPAWTKNVIDKYEKDIADAGAADEKKEKIVADAEKKRIIKDPTNSYLEVPEDEMTASQMVGNW